MTDHSATHGFGNDVQPDALLRRRRGDQGRCPTSASQVLAGTETNVLPDGSLDYADDVLEQLDWVVASLHTSFRLSEKEQTKRMLRAMEHPLVDVIGHPTGRLIERREAYALDLDRVIAKAVETGTFLEINANPDRRDLNDVYARAAAEAGVTLLINSDAHWPRHAEEHALRRRHRAARLAHEGAGGEHAPLGGARQAAQARPGLDRLDPAEARQPEQLRRAERRGAVEPELGAVPSLDRLDRARLPPPQERDQQEEAGGDHGHLGEEEADRAGERPSRRPRARAG